MLNGNGNNRPGVLTGNRPIGQQTDAYGRPVQSQQQGQHPQQAGPNILAQISAWGNNLNSNSQNNGGRSLYHFNNTNAGQNFNEVLGLDDNAAQELIKSQAVQEAGRFSDGVLRLCMQRNQENQNYRVFLGALERFKHPRKNLPQEQVLVDFVNEVLSNNTLYGFIVSQMVVQFGSEYAMHRMKGEIDVRQNPNLHQDILYRCTFDTINLQFFDYLGQHPNGAQLFYRMTEEGKKALTELEPQAFNAASQKFVWLNLNCPWKLGRLDELKQKGVTNNPLFDNENIFNMGFGPSPVIEDSYYQNQSMTELQKYVHNTAQAVSNGTYEGYGHSKGKTEDGQAGCPRYSDIDNPALDITQISKQNRTQYRYRDIVVDIPGTDWCLMSEENRFHVLKTLDNEHGIDINLKAMRTVNTISIFKIDWEKGSYIFRILPYKFKRGETVDSLVSNPEKLLPFMFDEDGVQKTSFDPLVMETNKLTDNGKIIPLCEVKELKKTPNILIGNKPVTMAKGNQEAIKTIDVLTKTYDTKNQIDAFALPMVSLRKFSLSEYSNMDEFYNQFDFMVKGNSLPFKNTISMIKHLKVKLDEYDDGEFTDFTTEYLTNLINRWFIEVRGYAETKEEAKGTNGTTPYLRMGNVFGDLDDLLNYLEDNDRASLQHFLDYEFNEFIKEGIQIINPKENTEKYFEKELEKEEDIALKTTLKATQEKTILFSRDNVLINLTKHVEIRGTGAVVIKCSTNPEIFEIVKKSVNQVSKHFQNRPQVLIKFGKDEYSKVWVATLSGFDNENVFILRALSENQEYCHPYPICE